MRDGFSFSGLVASVEDVGIAAVFFRARATGPTSEPLITVRAL